MKISILIPCYNEEKTIKKCIQSCLGQSLKPHQIVVVNDGSKDNSLNILKSFGKAITLVNMPKNSGSKSRAQEAGLEKVSGDIVVTMDADTLLDKRFLEHIYLHFLDEKTQAVAGYVKSIKKNFLTALREIEYTIGQNLYKSAQNKIDSIFVIPGCAAAFRTKLFKENKLKFSHNTITEDLDITYQLHSLKGVIKYEKKAIVYTQDPSNIKSYINQLRRWYAGQWQNLRKNAADIKKPIQILEYSLLYSEGIIFSVILYISPLFFTKYFLYQILALWIYGVIAGIYTAILRKRLDILIASPLYLIIFYLNSYVFIEQFLKEYLIQSNKLIWFSPARYEIL